MSPEPSTRKLAAHEIKPPLLNHVGVAVEYARCEQTICPRTPHFWTSEPSPIAHLFPRRRYCDGGAKL